MRTPELLRLARFVTIGVAAAAIHYALVVALVEMLGVKPLLANIAGFSLAFWCSFFGHRRWTFGDRTVISESRSACRFLTTALLGFGLNEGLFYVLLHTGLRYEAALAIAVAAVACMTYALSRLWAFRQEASVAEEGGDPLGLPGERP